MKSLTSVLLLSILAAAYAHEYTISVDLGDYKFAHDDVDGSIKMKIYNPAGHSDTFRLVQT